MIQIQGYLEKISRNHDDSITQIFLPCENGTFYKKHFVMSLGFVIKKVRICYSFLFLIGVL